MNIANPAWADAQQTLINCQIEHPEYGWIPFTASADDPEQHGRDIHAAILAGDHGPIGAYVPPPVATPDQIQAAIVAATSRRLTDFAATRGYSSLDATSKYKEITDAEIASLPAADQPLVTKFRTECRYVALATAQTWAVLYRGLAEVQAGTRPMPTGYDDIKDELPALVWPV
jgi:hypothetical protein